MRHTHELLDWESTANGWRCGRYSIVFCGPHRWALDINGATHSEHRRASDAASEARAADRRRRRWLSLRRNAIVAFAAAVIMFAAQAWRTVPNSAFAPAQDFALTFEAAYRSVAAGDIAVEAFTGQGGITGGAFTTAPPIDLGGNNEPLVRSYEALIARHAGECYVIRWSPRQSVFTGVLAPDLPCEVDPRLTQVDLFVRSSNQQLSADAFDWSQVLPPETFLAVWFIPLLILGASITLQALIGMTLVLIRQPRTDIPPLSAARGEHADPAAAKLPP